MLMYLSAVNTGLALAFFLPTIIHELGYSAQGTQVRLIPVFMVSKTGSTLHSF